MTALVRLLRATAGGRMVMRRCRSLLVRVPPVLVRVAVLATLHPREAEVRVVAHLGDLRRCAALGAGMQVVGLLWRRLQGRKPCFQGLHTSGKRAKRLPDRYLIQEFQDV